MLDVFIEKLNKLYNSILQPTNIMHKISDINNMKKEFNISNCESLGSYYNNMVTTNKVKGVVYTPYKLAEYIVKSTITKEDIINNPYVKIADPACGSGNLLICCYNYLFNLYKDNLQIINYKNNINLNIEDLPYHIINENIFGYDIDENAIKILIIDLFVLSGYYNTKNIFKEDFLFMTSNKKVDIFIGNPPYIGHKKVDSSYSVRLKQMYKDIYINKGDISYCFFEKALSLMNKNGKLSFITSRYFIESPSGEGVRNMLSKYYIYKIIDFYGVRPFKNIGIDPVIIFLYKKHEMEPNIEIIKPMKSIGEYKSKFINEIYENNIGKENKFYIKREQLKNNRWLLMRNEQVKVIDKIEKKCEFYLSDICETFQGIITGCDKAFIVNDDIINEFNLEREIIKPWIKSTYIEKNYVKRKDNYIIYSNLIKDQNKFSQDIKYISQYRNKLMDRRECLKGLREWYELQWGRNQSIFENKKIIFPYKSSSNRFALDAGSYYSADVYSLVLKGGTNFTYEFLLFLLNSSIYEFYFKSFAKKLGENMYEYYPNTLLKLKVPSMDDVKEFSEEALLNFFELNKFEKDDVYNCI